MEKAPDTITHLSISITAGDVYLADSAQVPRVHVQIHQGDSRGVLGHGRGLLERSQWCTWRGLWVLERNRPSKHAQLLYLSQS